jgi:hypothetical protein
MLARIAAALRARRAVCGAVERRALLLHNHRAVHFAAIRSLLSAAPLRPPPHIFHFLTPLDINSRNQTAWFVRRWALMILQNITSIRPRRHVVALIAFRRLHPHSHSHTHSCSHRHIPKSHRVSESLMSSL